MTRRADRILIVLFGAIGDVTRALPLATRLRQGYPAAHIAWAVERPAAPLLDGHPALDGRIVFERQRGLRGFATLLARLRRGRFDLVLDLGRLLKSGLAAMATAAPVRVGFHRRNSREGNWLFQTEWIPAQPHYSSKLAQYQRFADLLGVAPAPVRFDLAPSAAERRRAGELLAGLPSPRVAFGLGSSCPSRRWFPERTADVARALWERHRAAAVLVGTGADRTFADAVRAALTVPVRDLVGQTSLRELLAVVAETSLTVTPDSGTMHLSAALGVPVVSLWGATSPARSAPFGSETLVVPGWARCAPCYLEECRIGRVCMQAINGEAVIDRASDVLRSVARSAGP